MIQTLETYFAEDPRSEVLRFPYSLPDGTTGHLMLHREQAAEYFVHRHWPRGVPRFMPDKVAEATSEAFVNDSRWLVQCSLCNGAQYASRHDRRFFCIDCLNAHLQSQWVTVIWPDNADEIETVLLKRPNPHTRHWKLPETVADLLAENRVNLAA